MRIVFITAMTVVFCLWGVGLSFADDADEFTVTMTSGDETYYSDSGYITHTAEVETSHVFAEVDWYVNDVWQTTSKGDGAKKTASFTKWFSGHGPGKTYRIKAVGYSEAGDSASDLQIVSVYKNVVDHDGDDDFVYVEMAKCEWRGNTAYAEMSAMVNNSTGKDLTAVMVFGFWVRRLDLDVDNVLDVDGKVRNRIEVKKGKYACDQFSKPFTPKGIPDGTEVELYCRVSCSAGGSTRTVEHSTTTWYRKP